MDKPIKRIRKTIVVREIPLKYYAIGRRLRGLRGSVSQKAFSKKLGIEFRTYQRYERGERSPNPSAISKIIQECNTTADWILTGKLDDLDEKEERIWLALKEVLAEKDLEEVKKRKIIRKAGPESPVYHIIRRIELLFNKGEVVKIDIVSDLLDALEIGEGTSRIDTIRNLLKLMKTPPEKNDQKIDEKSQ